MSLPELVTQPPDVTENPYFDTIKKALKERQKESVCHILVNVSHFNPRGSYFVCICLYYTQLVLYMIIIKFISGNYSGNVSVSVFCNCIFCNERTRRIRFN